MNSKTKSNYKAWDVSLEDFPKNGTVDEQLRFVLALASLAPSAHNTQPWKLGLRDHVVEIRINRERWLRANDNESRQPFMSMGCLVENIVLTAEYFGFTSVVSYAAPAQDPDFFARITFASGSSLADFSSNLAKYIPQRVTNRLKYKTEPPSSDLINEIVSFAQSPLSIIPVSGEDKDRLAAIMIEAQIEAMNDKDFREELSQYVKPSSTASYVGMPGFTLGMPSLLSHIFPHVIKKINMSKAARKPDSELLIKHTPILLVICSEADDKQNWIAAGRTLEKVWLWCAKNNLACSPLAAAVQMPQYRQQVKELLRLQARPQLIVRCGYPEKEMQHSPRLLLTDLLIER